MAKIHERLAGPRPGLRESPLSPAMLAQVAGLGGARWSPDGARIAYQRSWDAIGRLFVVPADGQLPIPVTSDPMLQAGGSYGGGYYAWSPDGASLAYLAVDGKLWLIPSTGGIGRRLAEGEGRQRGPAWSPDGRSIAFIAESDEYSAIVVADVPTPGGPPAWPRSISGRADFVQDPAWSPDGRLLAWHEWDVPNMPWDASRILVADVASGERRVVAGGDELATAQPRFSPDGRFLAFLSDRDGWLNVWLADGDGGNPHPLIREPYEVGPPAWSPGARSYVWSPDPDDAHPQIAYLWNDDGNWRLYALDLDSKAVRPLDRSDGHRAGLDWSRRGEIAYVFSSPLVPPEIRALDLSRDVTRVIASGAVGGIEQASPRPAESFAWTSRDGAKLRGHVIRPSNVAGQSTPLLVVLHGGPTGQYGNGWSANSQYFVQRGWTVFAPEYRGSTGYGRAYTQALRDNWGVHDVYDTLDGVDALLADSGIDRGRVAVMGGSAGGYTVLMLLALAGDRIRAGVDLFGVTDLWELENGTHRLEAHYNHGIVGPLPEAAARYDERSPMNLADHIRAPLLVLQGEDDPVVPKWHSDLLVEAIRRAGGKVEYQVYPGEGHGWSRADTVRDALERTDRFLVNNVLLR